MPAPQENVSDSYARILNGFDINGRPIITMVGFMSYTVEGLALTQYVAPRTGEYQNI
jgi:hypothetical protein